MRHFTQEELNQLTQVYDESKYYDPNYIEWAVYELDAQYIVVNITEDGGEEIAAFESADDAITYIQNNI